MSRCAKFPFKKRAIPTKPWGTSDKRLPRFNGLLRQARRGGAGGVAQVALDGLSLALVVGGSGAMWPWAKPKARLAPSEHPNPTTKIGGKNGW